MLTDRRADKGADGRTDRLLDRRTVMTKLLVAFRNFMNSPEIKCILVKIISITAEVIRPHNTLSSAL
jgi:hypothetical protein